MIQRRRMQAQMMNTFYNIIVQVYLLTLVIIIRLFVQREKRRR